jgi:hypothetical protein
VSRAAARPRWALGACHSGLPAPERARKLPLNMPTFRPRLFVACALALLFLAPLGLLATPSLDLTIGSPVDDAVGADWTLPDGTLLHLRILDNRLHLLFLDEERNIVEPTHGRLILRGEMTSNKTRELFFPMRGGEGPFLTHPRLLYPPVDYWLRVVIPNAETEEEGAVVLPRQRFRQ